MENKFAYYYEDRQVKNDVELLEIPMEIINSAKNGVYDKCEFGGYNKPLNRWKSEERVYNIVKKLYKEYQGIYQYKPFYLSTDGGNTKAVFSVGFRFGKTVDYHVTLYNGDVHKMISPACKVLAIFSKVYNDEKYTECTYLSKGQRIDKMKLDKGSKKLLNDKFDNV